MTPIERRRRHSILAALAVTEGGAMTARGLRDDLEVTHNIALTADVIRVDLIWLRDGGYLQLAGDLARITEAGRDVVLNRAELP